MLLNKTKILYSHWDYYSTCELLEAHLGAYANLYHP